MQFAHELFDPTALKNHTPIPEFKLNYTVEDTTFLEMENSKLLRDTKFYYARSKKYFSIKPNASAKNNTQKHDDLPIKIMEYFQLNLHTHVVADHVKLYKEKSDALIAIDQKIMGAALLGMVAANIPFIPFVGLVSMGAWLAAVYFLAQRADAYNEYQDALVLLVGTCNWALGVINADTANTADTLSTNPAIKSMMDCLYPVLSKKQVEHLIADSIENEYTCALMEYDKKYPSPLQSLGGFFKQSSPTTREAVSHELENIALKKRGAEFFRCVYGLNRGSAKDFLRVFINAVPDLFRALYNVAQAATNAPQHP